jgi:hypothetical protein
MENTFNTQQRSNPTQYISDDTKEYVRARLVGRTVTNATTKNGGAEAINRLLDSPEDSIFYDENVYPLGPFANK